MLTRLFPEVRSGERQRFSLFFALAALLLAGQAVGLTVSESLLLSRLGVDALPRAILAASVVTVLGSMIYAAWVGRHRHESSFIRLLLAAVTFLALSAWLVQVGVTFIYLALFCFYCLTFSLFYTHFYTLAADYFDTFSAKRLLPLFGVGATVGELVGGLVASALSRLFSAHALLWVWVGFLLAAAGLLALNGRRLREWKPAAGTGPASSWGAEIRAGMRYLRRSQLGRALVQTVAGMILAMAVVQYIYSDVFVSRFPDENDLAAFLGGFLAVTNLLELVIGARLTPWLIRRAGVARTNLIHPVGTLLTMGLLLVDYSLVPAMLAWMNRKMLQDSLAAPVRALVFNAFPARFRGKVRAFMEGVVGSSAQAVAGLGLLLGQHSLTARGLVWAGLALGALYLVGALKVRREYLRTLVEGLQEGRFLGLVGRDLEQERARGLWSSALQEPEERRLARLAPMVPPALLAEGLDHPSPTVRKVCVQTLAFVPERMLRDGAAEVRLAAAQALWETPATLEGLRQDPDPRVQAVALGACGVLSEQRPELSLLYLPEAALGLARERLASDDALVRAAALRRLGQAGAVGLERLAQELRHASEAVRLAALDALGRSHDPLARHLLAQLLEDPSSGVRSAAARLLAHHGERAVPAVEPYLRSSREQTVRAALDALATSPRGQALIANELQGLVRQAWRSLLVRDALAVRGPLGLALENLADRNRRLAFHMLALLEGHTVVGSVASTLRFAGSSARADALEVLSNLGDPTAAGLLVLLIEDSALEERLAAVLRLEPGLWQPPREPGELLGRCRQSPDPFVRRAASGSDPVLDRLMVLRRLPLFSSLSLEELEEVDACLVEERFGPGSVVIAKDGACERLYFPVEGELSSPEPVLGAVSALDGGRPLDTVEARTPCRLYSLSRARLELLVRRFPTLAFPVFQLLTRRLHRLEALLR